MSDDLLDETMLDIRFVLEASPQGASLEELVGECAAPEGQVLRALAHLMASGDVIIYEDCYRMRMPIVDMEDDKQERLL